MTLAEKHRPDTLQEIVGQPVDVIRPQLNGRSTPNWLLWGPYGTGKTSAARGIANEIAGDPDRLLEINASMHSGIDAVRDKIERYSRADYTVDMGVPVIHLDEMDRMSVDAQEALRVPLERSSAVFVLSVNEYDRVHGAIKSRCVEVHFGTVSKDAIVRRLRTVSFREGFPFDDDELLEIAEDASGDVRSALQGLQQKAIQAGYYKPSRN